MVELFCEIKTQIERKFYKSAIWIDIGKQPNNE
jgi:hypothetical protein